MRIIYIPRRAVVIDVPTITTNSVTSITSTTAVSGGNVISDGGAEVTEYGIEWSLTSDFSSLSGYTSDGSGLGSFVSDLTGLDPDTTYYVRAYAVNSAGTGYGDTESFTSEVAGEVPTVTMSSIGSITPSSLYAYGSVDSDGGSTITERGFVYSATNTNPTLGGSDVSIIVVSGTTGSFSDIISGLNCGTTYYINAYATNGIGTGYGSVDSEITGSSSLPMFSLYYGAQSPCGNADLSVTNTYEEAERLVSYLQCTPTSTQSNTNRAESLSSGNKIYPFNGGCAAGLTDCYRVYNDSGSYGIIYIDSNGIIS